MRTAKERTQQVAVPPHAQRKRSPPPYSAATTMAKRTANTRTQQVAVPPHAQRESPSGSASSTKAMHKVLGRMAFRAACAGSRIQPVAKKKTQTETGKIEPCPVDGWRPKKIAKAKAASDRQARQIGSAGNERRIWRRPTARPNPVDEMEEEGEEVMEEVAEVQEESPQFDPVCVWGLTCLDLRACKKYSFPYI